MVYSTSSTVLGSVKVGDRISLSAKVSEYRSTSQPNDLHLTELTSPTKITVLSSGNPVVPIVLGKDRSPPTQHFSSLDSGVDGFLSVPANQSLQDTPDHQLQSDSYGLDFWESLEGQVVTIPSPVSLGFGNSFGEFWVRGNWRATGINSRGGLTINFGACILWCKFISPVLRLFLGPDGIPDGNPEAIIVGTPLDGTKNAVTALGNTYDDITGVVTFQCVSCLWIPPRPTDASTDSASIMFCPSRLRRLSLPQISRYLLRPSGPRRNRTSSPSVTIM